jgi:pimeloyl-ACP methyl ester carboxylesterase
MPFARVEGRQIFYRERGAGNIALVCLHGISSNSRSWQRQLETLSDRYRVIAWDAPGYGQSDDPPDGPPAGPPDGLPMMGWYADQLAGLLDALQLPEVVIVGLSMGGVLAQEFYRRHPARLLALALSDTNTGGGARPPAERQARLEGRLKALAELSLAEMARQRAPALLSPAPAPGLVAEVETMIRELHPAGYRAMALALDAADTRPVLPTIAVPTLVMWGELDRVTPRPEADVLRTGIPGAAFEIIPGAGHLSNLEQPAAFNRALTAFLDKHLEDIG